MTWRDVAIAAVVVVMASPFAIAVGIWIAWQLSA